MRTKPRQLAIPAPREVALADLNFAAYNPRRITAFELDALKASIVKGGFVTALAVQKRGMVLIAGHQRVRAVRELAQERGVMAPERLWAFVLDVDDREAKRLNVALNKIRGSFDEWMLGGLISSFGALDEEDALSMGFELEEATNLALLSGLTPEMEAERLEAEASAVDLAGFARSVTLTLEFETVADRDAAKQLLRLAAERSKAKAGTCVLKLLGGRRNGKGATKGRAARLGL